MIKLAAPIDAPPEWRVSNTSGFGPFITFIEYEIEDGAIREWQSRRHRKADLVASECSRQHVPPRTWWIASLFVIGATCFALGSTSVWTGSVSAGAEAATFFVGSLFFTAAAYVSFADVGGSICFLLASYLAWAEVCHSAGRLRFGGTFWGAACFLVAAVMLIPEARRGLGDASAVVC